MLVVTVVNKECLTVIHYTTREGKDGPSQDLVMGAGAVKAALLGSPYSLAKIEEEEYVIDLKVDDIELLEYVDDIVKHTGWDAVWRARQRLGEVKYNIYYNNCESYVNWVITEQEQSDQGKKGMVATGVVLSAAVIGAIGVGIWAVFSRKKESNNQ